mmetsp:Transcript_97/g.139  ORF Transcript_97/g.139 Transcript_97/m.139 type:complete len:96 (-) Transcript_97:1723-2010(-)
MFTSIPSIRNAVGAAITKPAAKNLTTASRLKSDLWKIQCTMYKTKNDCKNVENNRIKSGQENDARGFKKSVAVIMQTTEMKTTKRYRLRRDRAAK